MTLRARIREIIKWTALVMSIALLVGWVASNWYGIHCRSPDYKYDGEDHRLTVGICRGSIAAGLAPSWALSGDRFSFMQREPSESFRWWFAFTALRTFSGSSLWVEIPFWAPVLAASGVAFATWKLDRTAALRTRNNCCNKCGYHRAGLKPDALCPECSTPATSV